MQLKILREAALTAVGGQLRSSQTDKNGKKHNRLHVAPQT